MQQFSTVYTLTDCGNECEGVEKGRRKGPLPSRAEIRCGLTQGAAPLHHLLLHDLAAVQFSTRSLLSELTH